MNWTDHGLSLDLNDWGQLPSGRSHRKKIERHLLSWPAVLGGLVP